jgi:hypothetical protein
MGYRYILELVYLRYDDCNIINFKLLGGMWYDDIRWKLLW